MGNKETMRKAEFDKVFCRHYHLKLNNKTDEDIIAQLDKQESMQGYIRALIRADIARSEEKKGE